jgi:quercetin dioxygenase-like cupin family protein
MKRYVLLLAATFLAAQAPAPEVEITAEPHHHLTLENKSVRVFNVDIPAHAETLMHWHRHDYVYVALGDSEFINSVQGKAPVTVKLPDGETRFSASTFAHAVRPTDDRAFRNVTIELLEDEALRHATSPWDPKQSEDRALIAFEGGTQQILFVKDAVRVSELELQPGAAIPKHHSGPHLLVAVSDLDLRTDIKGQAPIASHLKSGETKWIPGGYSHTLTNTGSKPAKFVTLEFP